MARDMDDEDRAYQLLGAVDCLRDLLANQSVGTMVSPEPLAQLVDLISDGLHVQLEPKSRGYRAGANDD